MSEIMIMNIVSIIGCTTAISIACLVSNSALPILAFILIPRFSYSSKMDDCGEDKIQ